MKANGRIVKDWEKTKGSSEREGSARAILKSRRGGQEGKYREERENNRKRMRRMRKGREGGG